MRLYLTIVLDRIDSSSWYLAKFSGNRSTRTFGGFGVSVEQGFEFIGEYFRV